MYEIEFSRENEFMRPVKFPIGTYVVKLLAIENFPHSNITTGFDYSRLKEILTYVKCVKVGNLKANDLLTFDHFKIWGDERKAYVRGDGDRFIPFSISKSNFNETVVDLKVEFDSDFDTHYETHILSKTGEYQYTSSEEIKIPHKDLIKIIIYIQLIG